MALSLATNNWQLRMPAGSLQQWQFTFTTPAPGSTPPYPISGATFEYVVRTSQSDLGTPVIDITATPSSFGLIVVTSTAALSQVLLDIYPAATASLSGTYFHALWMNPGGSSALTWFTGLFLVDGNPQP